MGKNESEREKRKESNVSRTKKLAQLNRAGKLRKDAKSSKSGTNLKLDFFFLNGGTFEEYLKPSAEFVDATYGTGGTT